MLLGINGDEFITSNKNAEDIKLSTLGISVQTEIQLTEEQMEE